MIAMVSFTLLHAVDSDLPVYTPSNLQIERSTSLSTTGAQTVSGSGDGEEESCGCEDDFPPGAGFAFRREGYAIVDLEGKVARQRKFFENERITFKEILSPGDGKTFPQVPYPNTLSSS